ncbi:porin [Gluconacetobacter azotocaptans]|uniref:Porin n=1 Tax=Gluconacetobacter azotocaptans TaxID=142834 RepID=A0A7W4JVD8_9PROT|nr:porin [Gluconacetobacter azotocaptans]
MSARRLARIGAALVMGATGASMLDVAVARADEYTDLLDILLMKGNLTQAEHDGLLAKHLHHGHVPSPRAARVAASRRDDAPRQVAVAHHTELPGPVVIGGPTLDPSVLQARQAAASAADSARMAQAAMLSTQSALDNGSVVRVDKYVAGKGLTFRAGPIDINLSGFINGFYTYNSPAGGMPVAGGVSTGASGFDSSAVRNGLLPAGLILKLKTTQSGIDLNAVLGMYPGIDNAKNGAFNANTGGSPVGLGTAGLDFRQVYITAGTKSFGTVKIGRDLAIFGGDAILSDATLLSVGSTGSNASPGNTSLGRIGVGYVYADWIPQISYASPVIAGVQATVGVLQPLDEFNFAGGGLSAESTQHSSPMVQGKLTYDFKAGDLAGRIWAGFLTQHQQALTGTDIPATAKRGATVEAGEIGAKLTYGPAQAVAYYYRGSGLGTTGLFFDGIAANGRKRDSEGYYVQGMYNVTGKLKLVGSYGVSNLYQAPGENSTLLVRRNESEIGAVYYSLTDWLNLVCEYAHTQSDAHGPNSASDNTASGGAILLF